MKGGGEEEGYHSYGLDESITVVARGFEVAYPYAHKQISERYFSQDIL